MSALSGNHLRNRHRKSNVPRCVRTASPMAHPSDLHQVCWDSVSNFPTPSQLWRSHVATQTSPLVPFWLPRFAHGGPEKHRHSSRPCAQPHPNFPRTSYRLPRQANVSAQEPCLRPIPLRLVNRRSCLGWTSSCGALSERYAWSSRWKRRCHISSSGLPSKGAAGKAKREVFPSVPPLVGNSHAVSRACGQSTSISYEFEAGFRG